MANVPINDIKCCFKILDFCEIILILVTNNVCIYFLIGMQNSKATNIQGVTGSGGIRNRNILKNE